MKRIRFASILAAFLAALFVSLYYLRNEFFDLKGVSRADAVNACSSLDTFLAKDASDVFVRGTVRANRFFAKYQTTREGFQRWAAGRPIVHFSEPREFRLVYDVQCAGKDIQSITIPSGLVSECNLGGYDNMVVYDDGTGVCYVGMWDSR